MGGCGRYKTERIGMLNASINYLNVFYVLTSAQMWWELVVRIEMECKLFIDTPEYKKTAKMNN